MVENAVSILTPSLSEGLEPDVSLAVDYERQARAPAGSIEEYVATAEVVGYRRKVAKGSAATCREVEVLLDKHFGWEM